MYKGCKLPSVFDGIAVLSSLVCDTSDDFSWIFFNEENSPKFKGDFEIIVSLKRVGDPLINGALSDYFKEKVNAWSIYKPELGISIVSFLFILYSV